VSEEKLENEIFLHHDSVS